MHSRTSLFALAVLSGLVAGCTNMSLFKDSQPEATTVPAEPAMAATPGLAMSADDIRTTLSGKSWNWRGPNNSGVTLFAEDGTSLIEVAGRGKTKGKWSTRDGELCESVDPGAVLPNGSPLTCKPFTGVDGNYKFGNVDFTLAP